MGYMYQPVKAISFDCYGTLVQWDSILIDAIAKILLRQKVTDISAASVIASSYGYARKLQESDSYIPYKSILGASFVQAFAEHDVRVTDQDVDPIVQCLRHMGPHPEVPSVLAQLRSRYKLAIITNSDDDIIQSNLRLIRTPIDVVVTSQQARAYKPSATIFRLAHQRLGVTKDSIVHVAMSMHLDISACHLLGMRGIWINRRALTGKQEWSPFAELPDLSGLPALLEGLARTGE